MNIEAVLYDKIKRFEDLKNQLLELNKQIGVLTEQQRALYNAALEVKGAIDGLMELKHKEEEALKASKTAQLTLPEGVRPIIPDGSNVAVVEPAKTPVTLEVK